MSAASVKLEVHWGTLRYLITRRVGDASLAADITQEAYSRIADVRESAAPANSKGYLFAIASNLVVDHFRSAAVRSEVPVAPDTLHSVADRAPLQDALLLSREELGVLRAAVETLPPRCREVFLLHKFEQMPYAEIADHLGISRNTVMVHMTRALAHCRDALRSYHQSGE